jgi:DNA-directed RNA polymerase specialized sigma24 family protein
LTLFYFDECDMNEIASRTGWNRTLVKVRLHRARKRLKALLNEAGVRSE